MKKIVSVFLLVICFFSFVGCSNKSEVTSISSLNYLDNSSKENIEHNLKIASNVIKGFSFDGVLKVDGKEYKFKGEVIANGTIEDSVVHLNYDENNVYLKNGNIYIGYLHNNINIVVKDSVDNFLEETEIFFKNKEVIKEFIKSKMIQDINFEKLSNLVDIEESGYSIRYDGMITRLNEFYLPVSFEYSKNDILVNVNIKYENVSIKVPFAYELFNSSLEDIKDLLGIEDIKELID